MASTSVVFDILARDQASAKFDHLGNAVDGSTSKMSKFNGVMKTAGKAAAYGLGAGLVIGAGALVSMTKNAVEDEAAQRKLALALKNSVGATDEQVASVEKYISRVGVATGITDDEMRPALQRLVESTGSIKKAQQEFSIAMDVSAGTGKSLETVTQALMKANNGTTASLSKLGLKTKDAEGNALSLDQALAAMSETFGGQAQAKAESLSGKMDRLKLIMDETKESIGAKLIPVVTSLADWILTTAVPAVEKFTHQWQKHKGEAGDVRDVLEKVRDVVVKVTKVLVDNKEIVAVLAGAYVAFKVGVVAVEGAMKVVRAATTAWTAAQWLLNVALDANPIGLVVIGIAALVGGLILAYKKSETFREGVQSLWGFLRKFIGFAPLGVLIAEFGVAKDAVSGLIGMVQSLIGWLGKIHMPDLHFPSKPGWLPRMAGGGNGIDVGAAGGALIDSIVKGISKHKVKLDTALAKLKDYIQKHLAKLSDLLDKRQGIIDTFKGMTSSIFSADLSVPEGAAPASTQTVLDAGAQRRANAEALSQAVQTLIGKGLSTDLIQQLMGAGEAGQDQIKLLAQGTDAQIAQANADNLATQQALQAAGIAASAALGVDQAIAQEQANIKLADGIRDKLKELLDQQDKNTVVELYLDGHKILWSLKKIKRENGGHLGLGDNDK